MHVSYLCLDFPSRIAKVQNEIRAVSSVRACLHGGGGPQVGEVTRLGGVTRLSTQALTLMWSRLHVRWGNPPHVTSPTWGSPPSCKQALSKGSIKHMMEWNGYMNIEHTASLLNSDYQVKISIQTILEHLLWFIACEGEGNETAATVNNSNIPTVQERGRSWGEGGSRKRFGDNEITNMTPIIQRSMNTTTLFEYIMADSIFGTKPATSSCAMGRLIDLFGKLNVVPNSNRSRG